MNLQRIIAILILLGSGSLAIAADAGGVAPTRVTDSYAELAAGRIYYRDSGGTGAVVVLLHAASGNSLLFEKQVGPFAAAGYRVIAYDRAGQGGSPRASRSNAQAGGELRQVPEVEQLMDYLKIERFHLVGVAAGGGVALQYALGRPERVLSVVVANSIGNVQDASYTAMGQRIRPPAFNQLPVEMRELGPSYRAVNPEGVQRWLDLSQQRPVPEATTASNAAGGALAAPAVPAAPTDAGGAARRGGAAGGGGNVAVTFAALEKMTLPVLLLTGDADLYTPPSVLRLFKEHMPAAEMYVITESGHASQWENPEEFNRRVLEFLRRH